MTRHTMLNATIALIRNKQKELKDVYTNSRLMHDNIVEPCYKQKELESIRCITC